MRGPLLLAALATTASVHAAAAACDLPTVGPTDLPIGAQGDMTVHVVTGIVGICDPATRTFEIDLPALHGIRTAAVQLSLAGFDRRYGVHQIGFVLQSEKATPTAKGVAVQYGAAVDGLDRFQLAYTLYLDATP